MIETRLEVDDGPYLATTTVTSFRIIEALNRHGGATVSQLVDELGLASGTIYKHLNTLQEIHYVTKNGNEYRLGLGFLELGITARRQTGLYEQTYDALADLAESTGRVTTLMIPEHGYGVYLAQIVPSDVETPPHQEGQRVYLHATAGGKAILAYQQETVDSWSTEHTLPAVTDATITDVDRLREELRAVRDRRTAYARGEQFEGWDSVAVPLTDTDERAIGAVSLEIPAGGPGESVDMSEERNLLGSVSSGIESKLWLE